MISHPQYRNTDASVKLTSYQFKNCASPSNEQFVLSSLTLGPDPLSFPGPLTVAFNGQIKDTVDAPLKCRDG
nr:hypothetical protein BaRGS_013321 [Batillaria attramentaria]